jgi:hypothetical protein
MPRPQSAAREWLVLRSQGWSGWIAALAVVGIWFFAAEAVFVPLAAIYASGGEVIGTGALAVCGMLGLLPAFVVYLAVIRRAPSAAPRRKAAAMFFDSMSIVAFALTLSLFVFLAVRSPHALTEPERTDCILILQSRPEPPEWRSWDTHDMNSDFDLSVGESQSFRDMRLLDGCPPGLPIDGALACSAKKLVVRTNDAAEPHKDGLYVISAVLDADRPERLLVAFLRHWENTQGVIMRKVDWPSLAQFGVAVVGVMVLVIGVAVALARVRRSRHRSLHPSPRRYLLASVGFAGLLQFGVQMFELEPPNSVQTSDRLDRLSAHPDWCRGHPEPTD